VAPEAAPTFGDLRRAQKLERAEQDEWSRKQARIAERADREKWREEGLSWRPHLITDPWYVFGKKGGGGEPEASLQLSPRTTQQLAEYRHYYRTHDRENQDRVRVVLRARGVDCNPMDLSKLRNGLQISPQITKCFKCCDIEGSLDIMFRMLADRMNNVCISQIMEGCTHHEICALRWVEPICRVLDRTNNNQVVRDAGRRNTDRLEHGALRAILYGLQEMDCKDERVRWILNSLTEAVRRADAYSHFDGVALMSTRAVSDLYGLQRMTSDTPEVRALLRALTAKINESNCEMDHLSIGCALYGLQGMKSSCPE